MAHRLACIDGPIEQEALTIDRDIKGHTRHVVEVGNGDRFAALEPIKQGLRRIRGAVGQDIGQGIAIRHDWGQYNG